MFFFGYLLNTFWEFFIVYNFTWRNITIFLFLYCNLLYSINTVSLSYSISTIVSEETCCNKMWKLCNSFKGQCHMVFGLKHSIWAPYEQARTVSQLFCLCKDINCTCKVQRLRACMVNDYTDMKFYFLLSPVFTCWNYWYCVCKHTKIFYFSYKSVRSLQN